MIVKPYISVIVPTYRDWGRLQLCLDALSQQTQAGDYEIIVVNNDPLDNPPYKLTLPNNVKIISESKPGSYAARNAGLELARGEIVGFTDSDCLPQHDWISNATRVFKTELDSDRLTGPIKLFKDPIGSWFAWKYESITSFNQKFNVAKGVSVTANLFVKKDLFSKVGNFNSDLLSGGDIEWNERATAMGMSLKLVDDLVVMHPARISIEEIIRKSKRVLGGTYTRAQQRNRLCRFTFSQLLPPVRFAKMLIADERSLLEISFAVLIYWTIKIVLLLEVFRLYMGGKPVR